MNIDLRSDTGLKMETSVSEEIMDLNLSVAKTFFPSADWEISDCNKIISKEDNLTFDINDPIIFQSSVIWASKRIYEEKNNGKILWANNKHGFCEPAFSLSVVLSSDKPEISLAYLILEINKWDAS